MKENVYYLNPNNINQNSTVINHVMFMMRVKREDVKNSLRLVMFNECQIYNQHFE